MNIEIMLRWAAIISLSLDVLVILGVLGFTIHEAIQDIKDRCGDNNLKN